VLTPIVQPRALEPAELHHRSLAVDGNGELYQFLALIRLRDGTPLRDANGRVTSHLSGLFFRTTRLIAEHRLRLVVVFDGAPPALKRAEITRRRAVKAQFERARDEAIARGDMEAACAKATMTSTLTRGMVDEARELLRLLGVPTVQAPSEGEAQAAHTARSGRVWAAASKDYDTLVFGIPRLLRFLTIAGREFVPFRRRGCSSFKSRQGTNRLEASRTMEQAEPEPNPARPLTRAFWRANIESGPSPPSRPVRAPLERQDPCISSLPGWRPGASLRSWP
jgi:5'-3' exonuclease